MGFGAFALISLFYAVYGLSVVRDLIRHRRTAFDRIFTDEDRALVDKAAFFILLPLAVALHELGHAVAIWSYGGEVVDFGYYVFAGFVSYREPFSDAQRIVVSLAGSLVNVLLSALALGAVVLRRPPMRAAVNELLIQFAVLSSANALIFYPLLDFATGMNGDWRQVYDGGVPALSGAIFVGHVGILGAAFWASKNPSVRRRLAALTGLPPGTERGLFGDIHRVARPGGGGASSLGRVEQTLHAAATRVASGWPSPVRGTLERRGAVTTATLTWGDGFPRSVILRSWAAGQTELAGAVGTAAAPRLLQAWPDHPDADALTLALRLAMETVDGWPSAASGRPVGSGPPEPV